MSLAFVFPAGIADSPNLQMHGLHPTYAFQRFRSSGQGPEDIGPDVNDPVAPAADEVVMRSEIGVKAGGTRHGDPRNKAVAGQHVERPIHGIRREHRHPPPHPAKKRLGIGMVPGPRDLANYLEALVSHP